MRNIICPHCKKEFSMEKNDYEEIVKQLYGKELEERITQKENEFLKDKNYEIENLKQKQKSENAEKEKDFNLQIEKLKSKIETLEETKKNEIEKEIKNKELQLKDSIEEEKRKNREQENKINNLQEEISRLKEEKTKKIEELTEKYEERLERSKEEKINEINIAEARIRETLNQTISSKNIEIQELKGQVNSFQTEKQNAILSTVAQKDDEIKNKEQEIIKLKNDLSYKEKEIENQRLQLEKDYIEKLKDKDNQIFYLKDMKAKLSTKMVGESLEEHCKLEFEKIRQTGFKKAYFEKDNDIKNETKGDFIFRDYDENGNEIVSIMFEMKNENETTVTKHKNEDFFKKLDKDRNDKKCEYAVLVSLLEQDNELYNMGIVDVSHKYEKMYVIRPQFFVPLITLIRNASTKALEYKNELTIAKNQNIDITNFENELNDFKDKFLKNVVSAKNHFDKTIDEIDKTINHLQKIKEELQGTISQFSKANTKAEQLTIRSLTKNNPTMRIAFEELNKKENR